MRSRRRPTGSPCRSPRLRSWNGSRITATSSPPPRPSSRSSPPPGLRPERRSAGRRYRGGVDTRQRVRRALRPLRPVLAPALRRLRARRAPVTPPGAVRDPLEPDHSASPGGSEAPPSPLPPLPLPDAAEPVFQDATLETRFRELGYVVVDLLEPSAAADLLAVCEGLHPAPSPGARA